MTVCLVVDASRTAIPAPVLAEIHSPEAGRAVVVADTDRKALTILQDVLLGIGPDRDGQGWPKQTSAARAWVSAWITGRRIGELVIANADLLDGTQLTELLKLTQSTTRVWLLASRPLSESLDTLNLDKRDEYRDVSVDTFVAHFELAREIPSRRPQILTRFPKVPLDGILSFRRQCHRLLSLEDFRLVDSLLYRSCIDAHDRLADVGLSADAAWSLVEPVLTEHYPSDATITVLRGYQLAAFACGLHLSFEITLLAAQLKARTLWDPPNARLLSADTDPASAAMLVLDSLGLSPQLLSRLTVDALEPDGLCICAGSHPTNVPPAVASVLATHYEARCRQLDGAGPDTIPLFGQEREPSHPLSAQSIRSRIDGASARLGTARSSPAPIAPAQFSLTRFTRMRTTDYHEV